MFANDLFDVYSYFNEIVFLECQSKKNYCATLVIDLFSMSSCIATKRLVHNGGYIQKPLQLFNSPEILSCGRLCLVTKGFIES